MCIFPFHMYSGTKELQCKPMQHLAEPILFHPLKHHLQYIRYFIKTAGMSNDAKIKAALLTIGASQLDLYTGELDPQQIANETLTFLQQHGILSPEDYSIYLAARGADYRIIRLSDKTDWVLRWGVQLNRYVHLHPARWAYNTIRVKATTLKTAIATLALSYRTESEVNLSLINRARTELLGLSQIKYFPINEGLGKVINLLK